MVLDYFNKLYPKATTELYFTNAFELLVATILSAQCTDERVNKVTEFLFRKYKHPGDFISVSIEELQADIRTTGFYKNKARILKKCCEALAEQFNSQVPRSLDELTSLPGVGRKTANLVLGNAFGIPSIFADTHIIRVSNRLGLTTGKMGDGVERDLLAIVEKGSRTLFSNQMILFGRYRCKAKIPMCDTCKLNETCPKIGVRR